MRYREGGSGPGGEGGSGSGGEGGSGGLISGVAGGAYVGAALPQGAPFLIFDPLVDEIKEDDFNFDATYPWSAWSPELFGTIALAEFARTKWRCIHKYNHPPHDNADIVHEIEELIAMARDERRGLMDEILDQNGRIKSYFTQLMMLSAWSHPNTLNLIEMAYRVAQLVAVHFKLKFNRARPQQIYPPLVPLINSPWHASFPSGHTLESHMIALTLAKLAPNLLKPLQTLADRIGRNREVAGVHFRSDTVAGRQIAGEAFLLLCDCPIFQTVLKYAKAEPGPSGTLRPPTECPRPRRS